jgi:predicted N-acetyltransferase YhbS
MSAGAAAGAGAVAVRPFQRADEPAVLALLAASLGWVPDEQHARFFAWKHRANPFGRSPAWVATVDDEVVGFRTFLRWELERGGRIVRAVRAVDTATHPDHQGRGIFSTLTRCALDDLRRDDVQFVFNTPNERSRPGYLKMGWRPVRRLPVLARPRSVGALVRLVRARTAADKWSLATTAGAPASAALADRAAVEALLATLPPLPHGGLQTHRSAAFLSWRYGFQLLHYRAVTAGADLAGGMVVFRLRRRGRAVEAVICEELVPAGDASITRRLLREVLRASGADHAVRLDVGRPRAGFLPVPGQGPILTWRGVCSSTMPPPAAWRLGLGDIELF